MKLTSWLPEVFGSDSFSPPCSLYFRSGNSAGGGQWPRVTLNASQQLITPTSLPRYWNNALDFKQTRANRFLQAILLTYRLKPQLEDTSWDSTFLVSSPRPDSEQRRCINIVPIWLRLEFHFLPPQFSFLAGTLGYSLSLVGGAADYSYLRRKKLIHLDRSLRSICKCLKQPVLTWG